MAERIEYPPELTGTEEEQIRTIYRYLRRTAEKLNGNQEVTDENLSGYISAQTVALRNLQGNTQVQHPENSDVRTLTEELVQTMEKILREMQNTAQGAVTNANFTNLWTDRARTATVRPTGSQTGFIIATAIQQLLDAKESQGVDIQKLKDGSGGYVYSGIIGTDENDDPIYGTAIGKDVISWDSQGNPQYNAANAWAVFGTDGELIRDGQYLEQIATEAQVINKAEKYADTTSITDANLFDEDMTGKWILDVNGLTNFPSGLTGSTILMEVDSGGGIVLQRVYTDTGYIYTRMKQGQSWGWWYQHTGITAAI